MSESFIRNQLISVNLCSKTVEENGHKSNICWTWLHKETSKV
jgi:hypothetical protein